VALSGRLISQSRSCVSTVPVALAIELGSAVPLTGTVVAILTVASARTVPAGWYALTFASPRTVGILIPTPNVPSGIGRSVFVGHPNSL
jgi:hypothetical protein